MSSQIKNRWMGCSWRKCSNILHNIRLGISLQRKMLFWCSSKEIVRICIVAVLACHQIATLVYPTFNPNQQQTQILIWLLLCFIHNHLPPNQTYSLHLFVTTLLFLNPKVINQAHRQRNPQFEVDSANKMMVLYRTWMIKLVMRWME